jgi:hypothetical protein
VPTIDPPTYSTATLRTRSSGVVAVNPDGMVYSP